MPTPRMTAAEFRKAHGRTLPVPTAIGGVPCREVRRQTEKEVQAAIVKVLRLAGYTVMETSQRRASQVTIGLPDLFVYIGNGRWAALECKRDAAAPRSPEQAILANAGMIHVVWSPEMALRAVKEG